MGVQGLLPYILEHENFVKKFKLRSSYLVIDGIDLIHYLYYSTKIPYIYGGEYDLFSKKVEEFFTNIFNCDIIPFVILNGTNNDNIYEYFNQETKFKQKLTNFIELHDNGINKQIIYPLLLIQTFVSVMNKMGINHWKPFEDTNKEITEIANQLKCPVLSNNTDFLIFPLNSGFIPFITFNTNIKQEKCDCCVNASHSYFNCLIYNCFDNTDIIKPNLLPLLSALIGNDYVKRPCLSQFYYCLNINKYNDMLIIKGIIKYLRRFTYIEAALNHVKCIIKNDHTLQDLIENSIKLYNVNSLSELTIERLIFDNKSVLCQLPVYIKVRFIKNLLSTRLLNCFVSNYVFLPTLIENINMESIHKKSELFRLTFYSKLLEYFPEFNFSYEIVRNTNLRLDRKITKRYLSMYKSNDYMFLINSKKDFLNILFNEYFKDINWSATNKNSVICLIASMLISVNNYQKKYTNVKNLQILYNIPKNEVINKNIINLMHYFNQMQSLYEVYCDLLMLNEDIDDDFIKDICVPETLFCGRLYYNIYAKYGHNTNYSKCIKDCLSIINQVQCYETVELFKNLMKQQFSVDI